MDVVVDRRKVCERNGGEAWERMRVGRDETKKPNKDKDRHGRRDRDRDRKRVCRNHRLYT